MSPPATSCSHSPHAQQGIAMIMALMIMAIAVTVVASIFVQQRYSIRLTQNFQDLEQAYQYAYAAEELSKVWLKRDGEENQHDSQHDFWAQETLPPFEIDDDEGQAIGVVEMRLEDMQAYLNLNNVLVKPEQTKGNDNTQEEDIDPNDPELNKPHPEMMAAFERLFQNLGIPPGFRYSILDWIDPNDTVSDSEGAESTDYLVLDPPYRAANELLRAPEELDRLRMAGVEDSEQKHKLLDALIPQVVALPTPTALNINTATPASLLAVGLSSEQIETVIGLREAAPITDESMLEQNVPGIDEKALGVLSFASNYFRLSGEVKLGKSRLFLNSVLIRLPSNEVHVIMRRFSRIPKPKPTDQTTNLGLS